MSETSQSKRAVVVRALCVAAIGLLVLIYYMPVWWVSLKAPNYPPEAFPDGVRINFHMNGVFNGCKLVGKKEIFEDKALDCVHEMDAINHFVGMFPIASGGVVEKAFSPFLMSLVGVLILGFMIRNTRARVIVMAAGFAIIATWMTMMFHRPGGIAWQSAGYLDAMVTSLGQGQEEEGEELSPVIAALKKSLATSGAGSVTDTSELRKGVAKAGEQRLSDALAKLHEGTEAGGKDGAKSLRDILAEAKASQKSGKALSIDILKSAFEADQSRLPAAQRMTWTGSGSQLIAWHHEKSLGRWFNDPSKNGPIAQRMATVARILYWAILAGMVALLAIAATNGVLLWLLIAVPILLPVFFIMEYAAWLWWYGHSLNEMGAFTLKPFMPTVFGQGKVAQFSTHSYPNTGFLLMLLMSVLLTLAALIRRKEIGEAQEAGR